MPVYYLDSSALVKPYVEEAGSDWVSGIIVDELVIISVLGIAEVAHALGRRSRDGSLTRGSSGELFERFKDDILRYEVAGVERRLIDDTAELLLTGIPTTRPWTNDAIHLATAQRSFEQLRDAGVFVSSDRHLLEAARAGGLATENPEDHA